MALVTKAKNGDFIVLPNDALGKELIFNNDYEPHFNQVASVLVKEGDIVLDIGANFGYHTCSLSKLVGSSGRVLSFEPQRQIYYQLCGNIFLNNLRNVDPYNVDIGDRQSMVEMDSINLDSKDINIGANKIGSGGERALMVTLDQVIEGAGLVNSSVNFIKADMQGCESLMLDGAASLLSRCRPFMFIEVEFWLNCFGTTENELKLKLLKLGYILLQINTKHPVDHIAVPAEKESIISELNKKLEFTTTICRNL
jgi:FkbM family methyltransferase